MSFLLFFATLTSPFAAFSEGFDLLLAGGALKTCSSFFPKNCEKSTHFDQAKTQKRFQFSSASRQRLFAITADFDINRKMIDDEYAKLMGKYEEGPSAEMTQSEFFSVLADSGITDTMVSAMSDPLYYALLDSHEVFQKDSDGERLPEKVALARTTNTHSRDIYHTFVTQARKLAGDQVPRILVVTASSRDPFEVVDFYTAAFEQAGARVQWLPLSGAFVAARSQQQCERLEHYRGENMVYDRARLYPSLTDYQQRLCASPEQLSAMIAEAHGIFFNGGDQSKTLASLLEQDGTRSAELMAMADKIADGTLVIGGTSAGTAVQAGGARNGLPVPMFTSGDPATAMAQGIIFNHVPSVRCSQEASCDTLIDPGAVTLRASGGTGLFQAGLVDTHFSERDRETRLVMATALSAQSYGFGVDETTALLVDMDEQGWEFEVIGEHGVFVVDMSKGELQRQWREQGIVHTVGGKAHYWASGSTATLREGNWDVSLAGKTIDQATAGKSAAAGVWRRKTSQQCGSRTPTSWAQFDNRYMLQASDETLFSLSHTGQCSYQSLPFAIRGPMRARP